MRLFIPNLVLAPYLYEYYKINTSAMVSLLSLLLGFCFLPQSHSFKEKQLEIPPFRE